MAKDTPAAELAAHRWQIDSEGNGYRARCTCGWVGHKRVYFADARREGFQHREDNRNTPDVSGEEN